MIDIFEVHDCFTISELIALEDLGICPPGEASNLIMDGSLLIEGEHPVNTDGGLKGNGHPIGATGLAQIFKVVTQLRGKRKRQFLINFWTDAYRWNGELVELLMESV